MTLTSQDYWQRHWQNEPIDVETDAQGACELFDDIAPHLPHREGLSFLEIGCAPGRILADICGRLQFTAYGLDFACDPARIVALLRKRNVKVGKIFQADFFSWIPEERFDVVSSFGFIEHFDEAAAVVDRHFQMVKPGGLVIVAMPNFARGQRWLHWLFDRKNLRRHNTKIMNLRFLEAAALRNRAQLVEARYTGGHFDFWIDRTAPLTARRIVWRVVPFIQALARRVPGESNPWFSPYLFAIYRAPSAGCPT